MASDAKQHPEQVFKILLAALTFKPEHMRGGHNYCQMKMIYYAEMLRVKIVREIDSL
jgi:hypothetical protein